MGACQSGTCPSSRKALSIHSKTSVIHQSRMCKALPIYRNKSVSSKNERVKKHMINAPKPHQMPNDLPCFTIKHLPKDFPIEQLTPLKCSKYDFDPSESHSLSIFCFQYKLSSKHILDHRWYCKLSYCPFHHPY